MPETIDRFRQYDSQRHTNTAYAAMTAELDDAVGRILGKLDELGLNEDTYVIFTSDNGGTGSVVRGTEALVWYYGAYRNNKHVAPQTAMKPRQLQADLGAGFPADLFVRSRWRPQRNQ